MSLFGHVNLWRQEALVFEGVTYMCFVGFDESSPFWDSLVPGAVGSTYEVPVVLGGDELQILMFEIWQSGPG